MNMMIIDENLVEQLKRHEGLKLLAYRDNGPNKVWTIGYGHTGKNVKEGMTCTVEQAEQWLRDDIIKAIKLVQKNFPFYVNLSPKRQQVLANMCFNLGIGKLLAFHKTLAHIRRHEFDDASRQMLKSLWAKQVGDGRFSDGKPQRALELSIMMKEG